jgi:hypothetical protein
MMDKFEAQITLIREILGLSPIHDPVESVRILYERGRPELEVMRGPRPGDISGIGGLVAAHGLLNPMSQPVVTCRGSLALGTGCGHCQKCLKERANMQAQYKSPA